MNLTQKVLCYQYGIWSLSNILFDAREYCHQLLESKRGYDFESAEELYVSLEPKIIRSVKSFTYQNVPFELYLSRLLFFQEKTFNNKEKAEADKQRHVTDQQKNLYQQIITGNGVTYSMQKNDWPESADPATESTEDWSQAAGNNERCPTNGEIDVRKLPADKKSILLIALKNADKLSESLIAKISEYTGVPQMQMTAMQLELQQKTDHKYERQQLLRARRNSKLLQLSKNSENPELYSKLKLSIRKTNERIGKISASPTHQDISDITGIPKGTVDSNLYKISKEIECNGTLGQRFPGFKA